MMVRSFRHGRGETMGTTTELLADHVRPLAPSVPLHATPPVVDSRSLSFNMAAPPAVPSSEPMFIRAAGHNARCLPSLVHDALVDFVDAPPSAGALLLKGIPVGALAATPPHPTA